MKLRWHSPLVVWCVLCGLTLLSVALVEEGWRRSFASIVIVLIAAVKSRMVILHYMEANRAARHWRFLYETWNFAVTATLIIGYVVSLLSGRTW
jgi:heme/copper-type cytochrome/quinol oxidase subunit 4